MEFSKAKIPLTNVFGVHSKNLLILRVCLGVFAFFVCDESFGTIPQAQLKLIEL
jgi:hypothetical protein